MWRMCLSRLKFKKKWRAENRDVRTVRMELKSTFEI